MATVEEEMLSGNVDSDEGDDESEEQEKEDEETELIRNELRGLHQRIGFIVTSAGTFVERICAELQQKIPKQHNMRMMNQLTAMSDITNRTKNLVKVIESVVNKAHDRIADAQRSQALHHDIQQQTEQLRELEAAVDSKRGEYEEWERQLGRIKTEMVETKAAVEEESERGITMSLINTNLEERITVLKESETSLMEAVERLQEELKYRREENRNIAAEVERRRGEERFVKSRIKELKDEQNILRREESKDEVAFSERIQKLKEEETGLWQRNAECRQSLTDLTLKSNKIAIEVADKENRIPLLETQLRNLQVQISEKRTPTPLSTNTSSAGRASLSTNVTDTYSRIYSSMPESPSFLSPLNISQSRSPAPVVRNHAQPLPGPPSFNLHVSETLDSDATSPRQRHGNSTAALNFPATVSPNIPNDPRLQFPPTRGQRSDDPHPTPSGFSHGEDRPTASNTSAGSPKQRQRKTKVYPSKLPRISTRQSGPQLPPSVLNKGTV